MTSASKPLPGAHGAGVLGEVHEHEYEVADHLASSSATTTSCTSREAPPDDTHIPSCLQVKGYEAGCTSKS